MSAVPASFARAPRVAVFSPALDAVSGVSTHARLLMASALAGPYELLHFQVGSEGRREGRLARAWRLASGPARLAWFLVARRIDIVHLNTSLDARAYWRDLAFLAVARLLGRKVLNQVHGGALPAGFFPGSAWRTATLRWFARHSDTVVVLSREELQAWRHFAPGTRVEHIPNAVRVDEFAPVTARRQTVRPLHLAYVGRLVREKGVFETLEAVAALQGAGRGMHLEVAGSGRDEAALRHHARRLGLDADAIFVGPLFGAAKAALWQRADVFVFPTWSREGLPYALLEAMAAGCVPIVSLAGAIGDAVRDGHEAVIVPPRDPLRLAEAIERLDDDRDRLARLAAQARRRAEQAYSLERLGAEFVRVYARMATPGGMPGQVT